MRLFFRLHGLVIFLLLSGGKRGILHLQFHGFGHIFALTEPQNQFITLTDTFFCHSCFRIERSQLIGPSLLILMGFILLQSLDLVFQ